MSRITDREYRLMYETYIKQYNKSAKFAKSRGGTVSTEKLTFTEFKIDYASERADSSKLSGASIAKKMAKADVYAVSSNQAKSLAEAHVRTFGGKATLNLINKYRIEGEVALTDLVRKRRAELKESDPSLTSKEISLIIGQEFFGSE